MIEEAGALAFRAGTDVVRNPFYQTRMIPSTTGLDSEDWYKRAEAWHQGWKREAIKRRSSET